MNQLEVISAKMLRSYLYRSDTLIIDLRSQDEYYEGHLPGAIHIPYEQERVFYTLPKNKTIVLLCERGSASLAVAKDLAKSGYDVKSVSGGVMACRKSGLMY